jgi:hypothetical protein
MKEAALLAEEEEEEEEEEEDLGLRFREPLDGMLNVCVWRAAESQTLPLQLAKL